MAKTSKGVILSQASQIKSDYSFALIKATADNKSLVQDASSAELKVNALVEYSKDSQWDPKKLTSLGFPAGCFLIVDLRGQDIHAADLITNLALVRQYGYQAGVIDDLSTLDDIKALKANQIYLINSGKAKDDQDASLNGDEITDGSGKLAVGMSVKWQRDYTNVDVSGDHAGFVGMGQDTLLKGGNAFGYSTNGRDFNAVITPKGLIFRRPDAERMWRLLRPKERDDIDSTVSDRVKKEVDSATAEIPAAVSAANSAVSAAESAVSASKVNSDAIVAQSEAISEAKSAMDSATAEIQQTAANAASDAAKIRADVARVQNEVDTAKAANSASVEALKSDINTAKQDLADVHDSLDKAQAAAEQNQKLINDNVAKITSDVSATKQDLADVHDSLTKAQAAAEENQKAINDSIAEINANVDATNQDLAGVRKDLTKAQSDITANQKAIDDNVAQISDDITQDRKDIADVRQGLTKAQSDIIANQKAVNDNVAQINSDIEQDRKDIASAQQANADTVKQLDAYSKQAQEQGKTIKAVQDKQDGFSATLADVQGNVSQVSDKVDGLSASLKDTQGNVASVKAQADQLSATLTDHAKSIATLTASAKELSSTLEDADGRLSKVEQTAQTNSSTLSDVQGDLSQVKQNATKLVSTLKDAQGNISTLQQKADSVSTQLATAQGDIATLQTGVDSVKATLTSHDKSIHTLQADSKSLKDSMADAQGDISTLSKTATDVTSELEDHTGRLSKVEQSAAKQATKLSDLQGNLSQVEQKADSNTATISSINKNAMQDRGVITDTKTSFDSLTQLGTYSIKASGLPKMPEQHYGTLVVSGSAGSGWLSQQFVADTTGNVYTRVFSNNAWSAWKQGGSQDAINQVKQTADSNSATIRNVQGDVSTLKQTATGIKSTLASHEGDIHTLQADSKSLKDSMTNAQGDISTLQKSATSLDSEMKDHAGRLSKVEQNAATQATTLSDLQGNLTQVKQQADGLVTTLKDAQGSITQIQQKADGMLEQLKSVQGDIASLQTDVTGIKATLTSHGGDIHTLQADSKTLKDDMQDAQGNISSLQKSSTKLDSEFSSQDGRLSKVEQTAKEHTSTISSLGDKLSNMKIGGRNLVQNTDQDFVVDDSASTAKQGWLFRIFNLTQQPKVGDQITVSAEGTLTGKGDLSAYQIDLYNANTTDKRSNDAYLAPGKRSSATLTVNNLTGSGDTVLIIYAGKWGDTEGKKLILYHLKVEFGNVTTDWTPAPEDLATVTQVKQTADGIETTLKSAQGDIDQIEQKANGTSEQLADIKGDVTNIQKDVNGLKQTTADNARNIHTLQSDSKSLHDSMQDAQGDISTLKKTSTDVTSELKDHAGRISKTEQTASTLVNEFADQQGHLNRVEQTAQGTQQTVANQQGQINTIKTDAAGIHETLTGQGNQIANINVTLNGLNSKYEGVSGDLGKLKSQAQWITVTSTVDLNNIKTPCHEFLKGTVTNAPNEVAWWYLTVEGSNSGRITQTVIADQSNNRYTRRWADGWSAWVKDATQTDVTALSNRITTNSAQITQNQQAIALKADQSTVDNLSGEVSQNKAQFTVQAGQISSKVSGMETSLSDTASKLNNLVTSGRNYIRNSKSITMCPNGTDNYDLVWYVYDDAFASNAYCHGNNKTRFSFYLTPSKALPTARTFRIYWRAAPWNSFGTITVPANTTDTQYYELTMTTPTSQPIASQIFIRFMAQDTSDISYTITKSMLTIGDSFPDWSPAPEDTDAKITANSTAIDQTNQKIGLKADQTEVDNVKNTAQQISSRLDILAGEVKSKVDETRVNNIVDGKGYATTSTVQSLVDQKAGTINESITNLEGKFNSSSSVNLAEKTNQGTINWMCDPGNGATSISEVDINGVRGVRFTQTKKSTSWWVIAYKLNLDYFEPNQDYIISFDIRTSSDNFSRGMLNIARGDSSHPYLANTSFRTNFKKNQLTHVSCTGHSYGSLDKNGETFYLNCIGLGQCDWVDIVNLKIARGTIDKGYSPAPSDNATVTQLQSVTASIDGLQSTVANKADKSQITQLSNVIQSKVSASDFNDLKDKTLWKSTDSIDLNTAVSQQKIFVKGGSNLPPGNYWWYVQVESGYDSRIVQYAVSDRDNIHYSRQYDGSKWSAWSQGATESEITQLRDDINLRVKSGDLLSQINLTAGNTLIQSNKLYLDASSVVFSGRAFIPSAAIAELDADKITTGTLSGVDIHQIKSEKGRSIDISNGNISLKSNDYSEARITFSCKGELTKMFNAVGDIEGDEFTLFNFKPNDTQSLYPQPYFAAINKNGRGSGDSDLHFDHSVINGHEWWSNTDGVTFGRTWDGVNGSATYINIYAQSFAPHSQLSSKTRIEKLDGKEALESIMQDNMYTYQYKSDVADGKTKRYASLIIDDVHDVAQYTEPEMFLADNKKCRDDGTQLAYLIAAFQYQSKIIDSLQSKISKLEEKTNGYSNN